MEDTKTTQNKSSKELILDSLKQNPGQKASDLAIELDLEKREINRLLYGELKDLCIQDEKYCWYLTQDVPTADSDDKKPLSRTALSSLSQYYLACIGQDDEGGVSVFADNKFEDFDYSELNSLPLASSSSLFESSEAQRLLGKIRKDRTRLGMFFGYPISLKKVKSKKSNWEGLFVEPILLFPVDVTGGSPKLISGYPMVNLSVLKRFTNSEREQLMDELVLLEEELGLTSDQEAPELDDLLRRLHQIRPEWPWREEVNPDEIPKEPRLRFVREEGIYNRAVLVVAEKSPYTEGLESEIKALASVPVGKYESTALGQWIRGEIPQVKNQSKLPLLEVLPLNSEQRQAIHQSLTNPLTIITGPPGTGKSQVVTNLLINAAWQGKKVLFASKNNKAVDVVEIRINNLAPRPILLRMGSNEYQVKLAEYLIALLTSTSTEHDEEEFEYDLNRYKKLEEKLVELDQEEAAFISLRNQVDELDQSIEKIRSEVSVSCLDYLKNFEKEDHAVNFGNYFKALRNVTKGEQGFIQKIGWPLLKKGLYKNLAKQANAMKPFLDRTELVIPTEKPSEQSMEQWDAFSKTLKSYLLCAENLQEFDTCLKELGGKRPLEDIARIKTDLIRQMAENADHVWKGWLRLQPSKLSSSDRRLLSQYRAVLQMVIEAGGDLYSKLGNKIYKQYKTLSKSVSHLIPVWAVTSLSARGKIPFDPGYFDLVVFDEASQCDIASALPLLYRAKQAVVIGDPRQLSHISGLQKGQDRQLLQKFNLIPEFSQWSYSHTSLFDLASGLVSPNDIINLRDHHRSHADIIEFSNKEFYEGNLRVATNYNALKFTPNQKNGIRWNHVSGSVRQPAGGSAINETEANEVINELKRLVRDQQYSGSIGVVTPFRAQANFIRQIVNNDQELSSQLMSHDFLVNTVHKFQGDERDLMIFSPVLSKNMPRGALWALKNNGNLFNVAITRARAMLIVIGDQSEISVSDVSYLKNFAIYSRDLDQKKEEEIIISTDSLGPEYPVVSNPERVSDWERILYKALYAAGIKALPQYQVEKYTLDLALLDGKRMLDIEVDGVRYHRNWTGELCRRDQIRNQRLFELGWDVKRFWVYQVRDDIQGCVQQISEWFKKA